MGEKRSAEMTQKVEAIIFDLDGVLVDSEWFYYQRRREFLKEYQLTIDGLPLSWFIGADMRSLWPVIFKQNETTYDEAYLTEKYLEYKAAHPLDYQQLLEPDAKRVLQYLKRKGYKIALASSSTEEVIQEVLREGQLTSYFDVTVSGTRFKQSKPHPEIYEYTVSELGVAPESCLVIEDSEKGIQAAQAAKLNVWAIEDTRFGMNQTTANQILTSLSDVCRILEANEKKLETSAETNKE